MARRIIHVDMDAFYAAIEQRDNPELRGKPVIVGGSPEGRGVVSAASYEARQFGVHSGMPATRAKMLCRHGVFLPVDIPRYVEVSRNLMAMLRAATPVIEPMSLDEAFLDVTSSQALFGDAISIPRQLKQRIRDELQLTASVGVATNKLVAKLASDLTKPDGFVIVAEGREAEFIAPLPVAKLWGVGPATAARLHAAGLTTIGDVARCALDLLQTQVGSQAGRLQQLALGIDDRPVVPDQEAKSLSAETTFPEDTDDIEFLHRVLLELADEVGQRLRKAGRLARTVSLKLRFADFSTVTREVTLPDPTAASLMIYDQARALLARGNPSQRKLRLIGVGVTNITSERQLSLFEAESTRIERAEHAMDELRERFGRRVFLRATLMRGARQSAP